MLTSYWRNIQVLHICTAWGPSCHHRRDREEASSSTSWALLTTARQGFKLGEAGEVGVPGKSWTIQGSSLCSLGLAESGHCFAASWKSTAGWFVLFLNVWFLLQGLIHTAECFLPFPEGQPCTCRWTAHAVTKAMCVCCCFPALGIYYVKCSANMGKRLSSKWRWFHSPNLHLPPLPPSLRSQVGFWVYGSAVGWAVRAEAMGSRAPAGDAAICRLDQPCYSQWHLWEVPEGQPGCLQEAAGAILSLWVSPGTPGKQSPSLPPRLVWLGLWLGSAPWGASWCSFSCVASGAVIPCSLGHQCDWSSRSRPVWVEGTFTQVKCDLNQCKIAYLYTKQCTIFT